MSKNLKILLAAAIVLTLGLVAVNNKSAISENLGWMFEGKDEEVALPDLSNEEIEENSLKSEDAAVEGASEGEVQKYEETPAPASEGKTAPKTN